MFKMLKFQKGKWYYVLFIAVFLVLQAVCDLSLPDYTSNIVNVGIQQKGVPDGVPEEISKKSMTNLFIFMKDDEINEVKSNYGLKNDKYVLDEVLSGRH